MITVDVENVSVAFGDFRAVDGVSFKAGAGEIFGFLGANGAGKTTLIRAICGLLVPTAGRITVCGADARSAAAEVKRKIGYMSQKFTLYPDMTVEENLAFAGALRGLSDGQIRVRARRLLEFAGFDRAPAALAGELPGGDRQIMALCAALLHEPEVVFLDEPTAGVSPLSRARFWKLITELAGREKTVFVTTHYMDEAGQCSRIAFMRAGQIIALDSPAGLRAAHFPAPLYEVSAPEGEAAFARDLQSCGAGPVVPFGLFWHVEARDGAAWEKFAKARPEMRSRRIEPSLEDVFLKVAHED
ncbi:MAG: ABC transporter ATP-binding protein [Elusimicrobiales bacterium]